MILRRATLFFCLAALPGLATASCFADLTVTQDQGKFTVENSYYRLRIDAGYGGAVRSFVYKPLDPAKEWIYPGGGGLCEDMIWQQRHPGELQDFPYEYKVLDSTPSLFRVVVWRAFKQEPYPGLIVRKVYTLKADSPAIDVAMTLENPTTKQMFPGLWVQSRFFSGGNQGVQTVYRPSYLGIRMSYVENGRTVGDEFVRKPADGWAMTFDRDLKTGLLALVDYNYLQMHYSCLSMYTTEFFFDRVLILPGKSWTTEYLLIPVKDVSNCFYGDRNVFVTASQEGNDVTFQVRATDASVEQADVKIHVVSTDRSKILADRAETLRQVTAAAPQPIAVTIPGVAQTPVIVAISTAVNGATHASEFMYSRDPAFYHLQESASTYRAQLPKKVKPELANDRRLALLPHKGLAVWYASGLWYEMNRIADVLKSIDPAVDIHKVDFHQSTLGPELTEQPMLAEDLLGYDLVVMDNVGANSLGEAGEIAVEQYVKAGGSLLVCGGIYSMGKGRFAESVLADALPVKVGGFFDIVRLPKFTPITCSSQPKADLGAVEWVQQARGVKDGARVLMSAGDLPLLIAGGYGKGRVAVWLGTPMGEPGPKVTPFWKSPEWRDEMLSAVRSLIAEAK